MGRPQANGLNYFYDTEFIDTGSRLLLISIGVVCEDDREYYAVNGDMDAIAVRDDPWHKENTWPHLPRAGAHGELLDYSDSCVRNILQIRYDLIDFLTVGGIPKLWAWYDAHDFMVLTQVLAGPLHRMPDGLPMNGYDLKQEWDLHRPEHVTKPPTNSDLAHHALADAYWNLELAHRLGILERPKRGDDEH